MTTGDAAPNRTEKKPDRADRRERHDRHDRHDRNDRRRRLDLSPPRFNVDELAALAGAPLWQSVHDAVVTETTELAVFVEVRPLGHAPLRAAVPPVELPAAKVGDALRVRLLDPPRASEGAPVASARQAAGLDALDKLTAAEGPVPGVVVREVKGGYSVALLVDNPEAELGRAV